MCRFDPDVRCAPLSRGIRDCLSRSERWRTC
jgi:hypothetical protein